MGKGVISVYTNRVAYKFNNNYYTTNASNLDDELKTFISNRFDKATICSEINDK